VFLALTPACPCLYWQEPVSCSRDAIPYTNAVVLKPQGAVVMILESNFPEGNKLTSFGNA
jgi:hypothetical protein